MYLEKEFALFGKELFAHISLYMFTYFGKNVHAFIPRKKEKKETIYQKIFNKN